MQRKLGTIEHEIVLDKLSKEYASALHEVVSAWNDVCSRFSKHISDVKTYKSQHKTLASELNANIEDAEKALIELDNDLDLEMSKSLRKALDGAKHAAHFKFANWKDPWLFLLIDLQSYSVYVTYLAQRVVF